MIREQLPARRRAVTFAFAFKGVAFDVQIGFHDDGRPGEVFVTGRKSGSDLQNTLIDAAIAISIAMQHGVSLDTLARSFSREENGTPSSVLGLLVERVTEEARIAATLVVEAGPEATDGAAPIVLDDARALGFTGDICGHCQNATMVRNGTCLKCTTCGETTGCS